MFGKQCIYYNKLGHKNDRRFYRNNYERESTNLSRYDMLNFMTTIVNTFDERYRWIDSRGDNIETRKELLDLFVRWFHDETFVPKCELEDSNKIRDFPMQVFRQIDGCGRCLKITVRCVTYESFKCPYLIRNTLCVCFAYSMYDFAMLTFVKEYDMNYR